MRWIPFILLVLAGALLEAGNLLNLIAVGDWHIRPAPLMVLLVVFAVHCRTHEAIIASFIIGLAMDLAGSQMGPHTISYCLVGGLLNQLSEHVVLRRYLHQALLILAACLIAQTGAYWLNALKNREGQEYAYRIIAMTALYTALAGPLVWRFLRRIHHLMAFNSPHTERGYLR